MEQRTLECTEFESSRSLGYLVILPLLTAPLYALYNQSEGFNILVPVVFAILPILFYLLSKFSGGEDGEIVIEDKKHLDKMVTVMVSLLPVASAITFSLVSSLEIQALGLLTTEVVEFIAGLSVVPVALLLARPYGIKAEEVIIHNTSSYLKELTGG
nr:MAG: hypothetical protein J07AB56_03880 [Candidatus Nanosalinarum sp. J07AB56]